MAPTADTSAAVDEAVDEAKDASDAVDNAETDEDKVKAAEDYEAKVDTAADAAADDVKAIRDDVNAVSADDCLAGSSADLCDLAEQIFNAAVADVDDAKLALDTANKELKLADKTSDNYKVKKAAVDSAMKDLQKKTETLKEKRDDFKTTVAKGSRGSGPAAEKKDDNTVVIAVVVVVVVLIIAVGIVVVVLKGNQAGGGGGGERAVVSFENPMYDQAKLPAPQSEAQASAGYQDVAAGGGGLYSEPAAMEGAYQDVGPGGGEDFGGFGGATGGSGYMDVAGAAPGAGGGGYMDVAPNAPGAGSAGYMDVGGIDDYDDDGEEDV